MKNIFGVVCGIALFSGCDININLNGDLAGLDGTCVDEQVEGRRRRSVCVRTAGELPVEPPIQPPTYPVPIENRLSGNWSGLQGSLEVLQVKARIQCVQAPCDEEAFPPRQIIRVQLGCNVGRIEGPVFLHRDYRDDSRARFEARASIDGQGDHYLSGEIQGDVMKLKVQSLETGRPSGLVLYRGLKTAYSCQKPPIGSPVITEEHSGKPVILGLNQSLTVMFPFEKQAILLKHDDEYLVQAVYDYTGTGGIKSHLQRFHFGALKTGVAQLTFQVQDRYVCNAPPGAFCATVMPEPRLVSFEIHIVESVDVPQVVID